MICYLYFLPYIAFAWLILVFLGPWGPSLAAYLMSVSVSHMIMFSLSEWPWWFKGSENALIFIWFKKCILLNYLFIVYMCFVCMYVCAPSMCVVHKEARRGHGIPWDWSCRCLWATLWILGIKPGCSGKANSVLDCWAISPAGI